ncbi:fecCD transport family protein [Piscirickettsia salmonis]|uniref:Iron(III)-hydroxamate import system permease protein FhuB n=2 Tax=Piscirickettsia salmonis TaxID=1238 RepID=A0A9Q6LKZ4_PISSA|nr:iron ABC transporter permease [Piscirickettsia salmonis]ALA25103.1 fecCD transport family protein [Piscirickettsia salmonis]APS45381.1 fecCD transport family protein [Piscirickettsia salmonis]APS48741.1 fecCD transport family protein [Piscirickettsia salmonis]APS49982.1 fecCD transport family protein [Piscirickettsia salmonis]APS53177.1 fecCD transport family protein [Piscirickettsia salmonis]
MQQMQLNKQCLFLVVMIALLLVTAVYYLSLSSDLSLLDLYTGFIERNTLFWYLGLPRLVAALFAGAAFAIAGALFQEASRNLLASPNLLGVGAGAHLALTIALIAVPALVSEHKVLIASLGGGLAAALVFWVTSKEPEPVRIIFAGVAISLAVSALAAVLSLFYEQSVSGLFLWGAGDVEQQGWSQISATWLWLLLSLLASLLLSCVIMVYQLGDDIASSLGAGVQLLRWLMLGIGVVLTAVAVTLVGPVSFIGLFVPNVLRVIGLPVNACFLLICMVVGSLTLLMADLLHLIFFKYTLVNIPVGVLTAVLGAPALLWALAKIGRLSFSHNETIKLFIRNQPISIGYLLIALIVIALFSLLYSGGVHLTFQQIFNLDVLQVYSLSHLLIIDLRLPRVILAILAGGALAVSGLFFQGVIQNPLASPEVLGVSQGATCSALLLFLLLPAAPWWSVQLAALVGGMIAFVIVVLMAKKLGFRPLQLAMIGISLGALYSALNTGILAFSGMRVSETIRWLSGSFYGHSWSDVWHLLFLLIFILPLCFILAPWLNILNLGHEKAHSLGLNLVRVQFVLLFLATLLASAVVASVGMLSFIGLMAPHLARLFGYYQARALVLVSFLLGAILTAFADAIGVTLFAPTEIPAGLIAAIIGAVYLLFLLQRQARST